MNPTNLEILAIILGAVGAVGSIVSIFMWMSKRIGDLRTELKTGLAGVIQKLDDNLEFNKERFSAFEADKKRILQEAEREHERLEVAIAELERDVKTCQSRCGRRAEDYTKASCTVQHLGDQIASLEKRFATEISMVKNEIIQLRIEVKNGNGHH